MWLDQAEYERIGEILRAVRESKRISQADLAIKVRKPQSFISNYEQGQRRIDLPEFIRICSALDVSPTKIFAEIASASAIRTGKRNKL